MKFRKNLLAVALCFGSLSVIGCGDASQFEDSPQIAEEDNHEHEDLELIGKELISPLGCTKATQAQKDYVNLGNTKKDKFLAQCARETGGSAWCGQIIRPNPDSINTFRCTYGNTQVHQLIHPDESTWANSINAVKLVQDLERSGLRVCKIYNWWRPEPYNKNVGGAKTRHPAATSVDVRFCSNGEANRGFTALCRYRKQGRLRAIGHYGTSALHFGMGDIRNNTWGRTCP
jgi:hypothetical protein